MLVHERCFLGDLRNICTKSHSSEKIRKRGRRGKRKRAEKKRVDVKETRNLAKNKGREKKYGRKTTLSSSPLPPRERGDGEDKSVSGFSLDR